MSLSEDQVEAITREAVEAIFGTTRVSSIGVSVGPDWSGALAYFLDVTVEQAHDRKVAVEERARLRRDVRDRLAREGDDVLPYVMIHNRISAATLD